MAVPIWIEIMVIAKPMAFCSVRALPTISGGQAFADRAEKWGESATTLKPQIRKRPSIQAGVASLNHGKIRQHSAERASAVAATRALPMRWLHQPPARQPRLPMPMIRKAKPESIGVFGVARPEAISKAGVSVQKA